MNFLKSLILVSIIPIFAHATGVLNGGGGKGVYCQLPNSSVPTLKVLDLYEASEIYRLNEAERTPTLLDELILGLNSLNIVWAEPGKKPQFVTDSDTVNKLINEIFFEKVIFIPPSTKLPLTQDATVPILPIQCKEVQIAIYNEELGIQVDKEFWDLLDFRNQAALIFHELLYYYRRNYGAYTSDETRKFVGRLFSTTLPNPRFQNSPNSGYLDCGGGLPETDTYDFAVYPYIENGESGYIISFRQIANATTLGRTTAFFNSPNIYNSLSDPSTPFGVGLNLRSDFKPEHRSLNIVRNNSSEIGFLMSLRNNYTGELSKPTRVSCIRR